MRIGMLNMSERERAFNIIIICHNLHYFSCCCFLIDFLFTDSLDIFQQLLLLSLSAVLYSRVSESEREHIKIVDYLNKINIAAAAAK